MPSPPRGDVVVSDAEVRNHSKPRRSAQHRLVYRELCAAEQSLGLGELCEELRSIVRGSTARTSHSSATRRNASALSGSAIQAIGFGAVPRSVVRVVPVSSATATYYQRLGRDPRLGIVCKPAVCPLPPERDMGTTPPALVQAGVPPAATATLVCLSIRRPRGRGSGYARGLCSRSGC
jgi:hypothetical protein